MNDTILDIPDAYNRYRALHGLNVSNGNQVSEYITIVKVRRMIRAATDPEIDQFNQIVFGEKLNKFNKWTREKLLGKLSMMPNLKLMRVLYVREKEGLLDSLLCLLNKKKFRYDQKFLTNWFKYGTALKPEA